MTDYKTQDVPSGEITDLTGDQIVLVTKDPTGTPDDFYSYISTILETKMSGLRLVRNSTTSISVSTGICSNEDGEVLHVPSTLTASSLSLTASTKYNVYLYNNAGVTAVEVVTTAPVAWKGTAFSKTGDTSRRYVGTILSNSASEVTPFVHHPESGKMVYYNTQPNASPFLVLSGGTATTATAISCSAVVPLTAYSAMCRISNSSDKIVYYGFTSGITTTNFIFVHAAGNSAFQSVVMDMPIDSSSRFFFFCASAVGAGSTSIDLMGYTYFR